MIDTCTLAISAAVTLVLSWAQIQTALAALMSVCIQNPVQPARCGRAFYGAPKQVRGRRKRRNELSGRLSAPYNSLEELEGIFSPLNICSCDVQAGTHYPHTQTLPSSSNLSRGRILQQNLSRAPGLLSLAVKLSIHVMHEVFRCVPCYVCS